MNGRQLDNHGGNQIDTPKTGEIIYSQVGLISSVDLRVRASDRRLILNHFQ